MVSVSVLSDPILLWMAGCQRRSWSISWSDVPWREFPRGISWKKNIWLHKKLFFFLRNRDETYDKAMQSYELYVYLYLYIGYLYIVKTISSKAGLGLDISWFSLLCIGWCELCDFGMSYFLFSKKNGSCIWLHLWSESKLQQTQQQNKRRHHGDQAA